MLALDRSTQEKNPCHMKSPNLIIIFHISPCCGPLFKLSVLFLHRSNSTRTARYQEPAPVLAVNCQSEGSQCVHLYKKSPQQQISTATDYCLVCREWDTAQQTKQKRRKKKLLDSMIHLNSDGRFIISEISCKVTSSAKHSFDFMFHWVECN